MSTSQKVVVFYLDDRKYALDYASVERVVRMVEMTPLPGSSGSVLGVINVQGNIMPVLNLRQCLGLPVRETVISDQLIIVRTNGRCFALPVEGTEGVVDFPGHAVVAASEMVSMSEYVEGIAKLAGNMVVINNLEKLFSMASSALPLSPGHKESGLTMGERNG